jgi:hypothetical protein
LTGDWQTYLTRDEAAAWAETDQWLSAEASRFKKLLGFTRKPIEYAYSKVPESLRESIATAILSVLTQVRDGSAGLVSVASVRDKIGPIPNDELGMFRVNIRHLDAAAHSLIGQSKNLCTAEGAATGAAGLPGIVVDIPALYGLLFRMIAQVSVCYGYSADPEEERTHMLKILDIGHQLEPETKRQGMDELSLMQQMIRDDVPVAEVQRFAVQKGLQTMARHLGLALTQRKLAQSVVLMGGVVGAGVNRQLAGEVGEVAFHAYRRRHLVELAHLRRSGRLAGTRMSAGGVRIDEEPILATAATQRAPNPDAAETLVSSETTPLAEDGRNSQDPSTSESTDGGQVDSLHRGLLDGPAEVDADDSSSVLLAESPSAAAECRQTEVSAQAMSGSVDSVHERVGVEPTGGAFQVHLHPDLINSLLRRVPDYRFEYRHGCLLGRVKLPISAVQVLVIPSCDGSHIAFTLPFSEVKSEGAGSFLLPKIMSTFWGSVAKQIESNAVPRLQRLGFCSDALTLEQGKGPAGEFGRIKLSLAALNRWLESQHPSLTLSLTDLKFSADGCEIQGRGDGRLMTARNADQADQWGWDWNGDGLEPTGP